MLATQLRATLGANQGAVPSVRLALRAASVLAGAALALVLAPAARAQNYTTMIGATNFSTNVGVKLGYVNAANGDPHIEIPLGAFPQRGRLDFAPRLEYDGRIWVEVNNGYTTAWQPTNVGSGGWRLVLGGAAAGGTVNYSTTAMACATHGNEYQYQNFTWTAPDGTVHPFGALQTIRVAGTGCPDSNQSTAAGYATDSTGYYISVTNYIQSAVWDRNGTTVFSATGTPAQYEDSNGNYYTVNANGDLVDSLGRTPVTTTTNCGSSNVTCYDVLNAQGGTSRYTVTWESISVNTSFGIPPAGEFIGNISVIQSVQLPDGTSYQFTYDSRPSPYICPSSCYGEMTQAALPTGGTTTYGYVNFQDSAGNVNRWIASESDGGGRQTYTQSTVTCGPGYSNCNQVVVNKPSGEQITYTFGISDAGAWPTQAQYNLGTSTESVSTTWDTTNQVKQSESVTWPAPGGTITRTSQWSNYNACGDPGQISEWKYYTGSLPANADRVTTVTFTSESGPYANIACLPSSTTVQVGGVVSRILWKSV